MADEIMRQGVIGLADIVIKPGLINVDFADVRIEHARFDLFIGLFGLPVGAVFAFNANVKLSLPVLPFSIAMPALARPNANASHARRVPPFGSPTNREAVSWVGWGLEGCPVVLPEVEYHH